MAATERRVREVWRAFLRLGVTAFGGPAAHIAAMDDEFVRVRGWLSRAEFADLLSASQVLPGPSSTELAMLIGYRRASWRGLVAAGAAFILPATVLVWAIAWAYSQVGARVEVAAVFAGIRPVVCAVLVVALWRLAAQQPRSVWVGCVGVVCFGARLFGVPAAMILLGAALAMMAARVTAGRWERVWAGVVALGVLALAPWMLPSGGGADASAVVHSMSWPWPLLSGARGAASESAGGVGAGSIGWVFAQIGSIVFGSGYVLVAYLRSAFIEQRGWLSEAQLLDAVAVGQVTPGPVFSTATFIGYVLYGTPGALAATVGIFLPAFCYAALSGIVVPRIRASLRASAALDGLNVASLSLLGAMLVSMLRETLNAPLGMLIAGVALAMLLLLRVGTLWVLLGGALVGLLSAYAAPFGLAALRAGAVG